jgi:hypothetical protein
VNGSVSNPRRRPRPLPATPLVVRRRYLTVVPRSLPAAPLASQVLDRGAQADALGAAQVLDCGFKAVTSATARCASQILDRGAQVAARGAVSCA